MCVCVFVVVNFISECTKWGKVVEGMLNDIFSSVSVIQIKGEMDKHGKCSFIKLSTGFLKMVGYDPHALFATSAANTGIDNQHLQIVNRFSFPCYPTTLLQECGRNARVVGMTGIYVIFTSWLLFVKLASSIFTPSTE